MSLKVLLLFVIFLFSSYLGVAQSLFDNPQIIDKDNGLPSNSIADAVRDNRGFVWIATHNEICKWDGKKIKIFPESPDDSTALSGGIIKPNTLLWDNENERLIIGTDHGLSFFYTEKSIFKNYYIHKNNPNAIHGELFSVYFDKQKRLWLATSAGFAKYIEKEKRFVTYEYKKKLPANFPISLTSINTTQDIKQDVHNDSIFWISNLGGLLKFNQYTEKITYFYYHVTTYYDQLNQLRDMVAHPNGKLYIRTWNSDMVVFNTSTLRFINHFGPLATTPPNFYKGAIFPNSVKSENEIWVTSRLGIGIFNTETDTIRFLKAFKNKSGHKILLQIAFSDKTGIWYVSEYGLYYFKYANRQIDNYFFKPSSDSKFYLPATIVENQNNGILYLGYSNGDGLHAFDLKDKLFHVSPYQMIYDKNYVIQTIIKTKAGKYLTVTPNGIYEINPETNKMEHCFSTKHFYNLTSIVEDTSQNLWVSSREEGIQKVDCKNKQFVSYINWKKKYQEKNTIPYIGKLACDKNNRIWFSGYKNYGYYEPQTNKIKVFADSIRNNTASCFYTADRDTIWVGFQQLGLGYILPDDPEKGAQIMCSALTILKSNRIMSIEKDPHNRLWLLTGAGLEMISQNRKESVLFSSKEGLVKYDSWSNRDPTDLGKLKMLSTGKMAVLYRHGIGFFNPDSIVVLQEPFSVYLYSIKINNTEIDIQYPWDSARQIELNYNQNYLEFNYSVITPQSNEKFQLYHQLSNVDNQWTTSKTGIISYANLSPGRYSFRIKAMQISGAQKSDEQIYYIVIHAPWWATWWAYLLYFALAVALIFLFYRYYYKRKMAQNEAKRLRELDTAKNRFFQNITHEFRTPLTVIKGITNAVMEQMSEADKDKFGEMMSSVDRNSNKLLSLINQILDLSKIENNKLELKPSCGDIIYYLKVITESFHSLAKQKKIEFVYYNEIEELCMDFDQDKLTLTISNLLSNAIKFTPENGKIILHVKTENDSLGNRQLVIKVKDSGIGIHQEEISAIFDRFYQAKKSDINLAEGTGIGLAIVKEYVALMKGNIDVESVFGKGSTFIVSLPISMEAKKGEIKNIEGKIVPFAEPEKRESKPQLISENELNAPVLLIVEDNYDVANYIASCIDKKYKIIMAKEGEEGIQKALEYIPDIIITDLMMPKKDGFELCETLKNDIKTSHIPIIMLTARAMNQDKLKGYSVGADAYLIKPFSKAELSIRIEQLTELRKKLQKKYGNTTQIAHKPKSAEDIFIAHLFGIIDKHITETDFKSLNLATHAKLSESQLYRKIKALTDKSTSLFIRDYKLEKAKRLLDNKKLNISEIAYDCGFSDPAWFSKAFKEKYGVSPVEFRREEEG